MSDLEKLERLEQSITQLLYEIDSNFSKCHRVITSNILPIVEKYAENSGAVWEHSKFWKQFFEASANVSLSGYEEQANQDAEDYTQDRVDGSTYLDADSQRATPQQKRQKGTDDSPFDLTGDDANSSSMMDYSKHPTETPLTQRMDTLDISASSPMDAPSPNGGHARLSTSQHQSVGRPRTAATPATNPKNKNKKAPLLHRVLDSNWKVQATPHSVKSRYTPDEETYLSTSPTSSPPELTNQLGAASSRQLYGQKTPNRGPAAYQYDSDDDSSMGGMSPPKFLAFSLPPSKLLRTPAKEAAKHMVDEILRTAGANDISTIPSETPRDPLDDLLSARAAQAQGHSTLLQESHTTRDESRRLFGQMGGEADETPIVRKTTGVLEHWHESGEGSNSWL